MITVGEYYSLAGAVFRFAAVVTVEKFSVKQLHGDDSKNEMKQYIHYQYVYDVF